VAAVPMRLRDEVIGALNLFRLEPHSLSEIDLMAARALADVATIAIIQERAAQSKDVLVGQLERALGSRTAIEQAKGIISHATGLSLDKAFELLRAYSRNNNLRLREVAQRAAEGDLDPIVLRAG
jgi:GAF domain-containing protein